MQKLLLEISDELLSAINKARGTSPRNPAIEAWLWKIGEIRTAAAVLGISKPQRRGRGRPKKAAPESTPKQAAKRTTTRKAKQKR